MATSLHFGWLRVDDRRKANVSIVFISQINCFHYYVYRMVKIQDKLCRAAKCLEYFTTQEWEFDDTNVRTLSSTLSEQDKREFCFDVAQIKWEEFIENYVLGIRR